MSDNANLLDIKHKPKARRLDNQIVELSAALFLLWISEGKVSEAKEDR
jgi:hypothetical protein